MVTENQIEVEDLQCDPSDGYEQVAHRSKKRFSKIIYPNDRESRISPHNN